MDNKTLKQQCEERKDERFVELLKIFTGLSVGLKFAKKRIKELECQYEIDRTKLDISQIKKGIKSLKKDMRSRGFLEPV